MTLSSSPLTSPGRDGRVVRARSSGTQDHPIVMGDSDDDVVSDSSSSSPYFTQPTQIIKRKTLVAPKDTQPTQIVNRPTLKGSSSAIQATAQPATQPTQVTDRPIVGLSNKNRNSGFLPRSDAASSNSDMSSPIAKVEVARSSPYRSSPPQPRRGLAMGMAPSGTAFRPPQKAITSFLSSRAGGSRIDSKGAGTKNADGAKRDNADSSDELNRSFKFLVRSDSSSSSDRSVHADIQRTSFQRRHSPTSANDSRVVKAAQQAAEFENFDSKIRLKAAKLREKLGRRPSLYICAQAIKLKKGDMEAAYKSLLSARGTGPTSSPPSSTQATAKRSSVSRSPSPVPAPKRRRLVRGRNPANVSPAKPLISLIDSDDDVKSVTSSKDGGDDYGSESDEETDEEDQGRNKRASSKQLSEQPLIGTKRVSKILEYMETCTVDQLAADAKISKDNAQVLISKRPFLSIGQIKAVYHYKTVRKRRERVSLGEDVFYELNHHIKRLNAIDRVVQQCDTQGSIIRSKVDSWRMDKLGKIKEIPHANAVAGALPFSKEPKLIKCDMFPYQLYGMNWMFQLYTRGLGAILGDDMGLGKTCQVIAFLALLVEAHETGLVQNEPGPNLIVVPASLVDNWQKEFEKFAPDLSVVQYSGNPDVRDELAEDILSSPGDYHVILTSISTMNRQKDVVWMNKIGINAAIFDEGHTLKNSATQIYRRLIQIKTKWKLMITGTPIQNNIMELITLMSFLSPSLFNRDRDSIEELFAQKVSLQQVSEGATLLSDRIQRARSILEPFILSRKKRQVSSLDPPTRRVVFCDMTDQQKAEYNERVSNFRRMKGQKSAGKRKGDDNNPWIQLRKAATHPQLFRRHFTDKKCEEMAKLLMDKVPDSLDQSDLGRMVEELKGYSDFELHLWCRDYRFLQKFDVREGSWFESGKLQKLIELVREYEQNGDRVLVFSPFRKSLGILEECLHESGIKHRILAGETSVSERQEICDEFQTDETISVFLLTTLAGGLGLNLTGANKIVIFDQSGNPQQDIQAENRAHRLGQKRNVEVIRLVSKGTIDELIYKACNTKLVLAGEITGHNEDMGEVDYTEEMGEADEQDILKSVTEQVLKGQGGGLSATGGYITPPKSEM